MKEKTLKIKTDRLSAPWIIAHRGAMQEAPENTRSAFDIALSYPIDGIEFDVQMSKDEVPIIYHNKTLSKISGGRRRIADFSHKELNSFDWGKWYSKDYKGERILTLDQMLKRYASKTRLLIEIKSNKKDSITGRSRVLTQRVLELINKQVREKHLNNLSILSFDPDVLNHAHAKAPHLNYVLNLLNPSFMTNGNNPFSDYLFAVCGPISKITKKVINSIQKKGLLSMTYACNNPGQANKAMNLNINVIMTDNPGWLTAFLSIKKGRV